MPALNIMAIQETVRNSGSSSSPPSGMRPYLLAASHSTKITKKVELRTKNQPVLVMTQVCAELEAEPEAGRADDAPDHEPHAITPVIQKMAGSILLRHDV